MREKKVPLKSLPHVIIIWQNLVKSGPKPKGKAKEKKTKYSNHLDLMSVKETHDELGLYIVSRELSYLQREMVRVLKEHGGSASLETILGEMQKISPDSSSAIFQTLTSKEPNGIFVPDQDKGEGNWFKLRPSVAQSNEEDGEREKLDQLILQASMSANQDDPLGGSSSEEGSTVISTSRKNKANHQSSNPPQKKQKLNEDSNTSAENDKSAKEDNGNITKKAPKESASISDSGPKLTGMQDILMKILLSYGGVCSFDQIYQEFTKQNGNSHGNDHKRICRALLASLSHNPPGNFRKAADGNSWMIAPKAVGIAEQLVREDPKYSLDKLKSKSH